MTRPALQAYEDAIAQLDQLWAALTEAEQAGYTGWSRPQPARRYDNIPTWEELQDVRTWIMMGCPAAQRDLDPREMVKRLWKLMEGLPAHVPIYAWGAPEWKAEIKRIREERGELRVDLVRDTTSTEEKP